MVSSDMGAALNRGIDSNKSTTIKKSVRHGSNATTRWLAEFLFITLMNSMHSILPDDLLPHSDGFTWSSDELSTRDSFSTPNSLSSSITSHLEGKMDLSTWDAVQLPIPFYPPSLVRREPKYREARLEARQLPSSLGFPDIPQEIGCKGIHPLDT